MQLREREYRACGECGARHLERDEAFGCDTCQAVIDLAAVTPKGHHGYLKMDVFTKGEGGTDSYDMHFCSWRCALLALPRIQSDDFVTLPYLIYDEDQDGIRARDLLALLQPTLAALQDGTHPGVSREQDSGDAPA